MVTNMDLSQEAFSDSSGLNVLQDSDSLIPMNILSGGIQDSRFHYYGFDIGSRDYDAYTWCENDWEGYDTEEIWDVIQSEQYKANYRMVRVIRDRHLLGKILDRGENLLVLCDW